MLLLVLILQSVDETASPMTGWAAVGVATILTSVLEAFTTQIDNLFLPLYYYATLLAMS